jgi:hypothetical protein
MTHRYRTRVITLSAACVLALLASGCATKAERKPTAQERHDRALKDPFGYKPDWSNTNVSGGGTAELDKDGLRKDLDNVLIR